MTVRLRLTVRDEARAARASALLGPANPARHGKVIWLYVSRLGGGTVAGRSSTAS